MKEYLAKIAEELKAGHPVPSTTIRNFLTRAEAKRRGFYIVQNIREELKEAGLDTSPDFEEPGWIDTPINFILKTKEPEQPEGVEPGEDESMEAGDDSASAAQQPALEDTSYRVDQLRAANQKVVSVKPDDLINKVVTLMLARNLSQVPVMTTEWNVKGMITWQTITVKDVFGMKGQYARDFVENHHEVGLDSSLFSAIPAIDKYGYVLVKSARDKTICGIVTSSDLSNEFRDRTEPYLLISEIEGWLRSIIGKRFSLDELADVCLPRQISDVTDMTFGDYKQLLQEPNRWAKLGLNIDRWIFCERLEAVKDIRNDVAHFNFRTRGEDLDSLRDFANFLAKLSRIFQKNDM